MAGTLPSYVLRIAASCTFVPVARQHGSARQQQRQQEQYTYEAAAASSSSSQPAEAHHWLALIIPYVPANAWGPIRVSRYFRPLVIWRGPFVVFHTSSTLYSYQYHSSSSGRPQLRSIISKKIGSDRHDGFRIAAQRQWDQLRILCNRVRSRSEKNKTSNLNTTIDVS